MSSHARDVVTPEAVVAPAVAVIPETHVVPVLSVVAVFSALPVLPVFVVFALPDQPPAVLATPASDLLEIIHARCDNIVARTHTRLAHSQATMAMAYSLLRGIDQRLKRHERR